MRTDLRLGLTWRLWSMLVESISRGFAQDLTLISVSFCVARAAWSKFFWRLLTIWCAALLARYIYVRMCINVMAHAFQSHRKGSPYTIIRYVVHMAIGWTKQKYPHHATHCTAPDTTSDTFYDVSKQVNEPGWWLPCMMVRQFQAISDANSRWKYMPSLLLWYGMVEAAHVNAALCRVLDWRPPNGRIIWICL